MMRIPFNKPYMTGQELAYIKDAHQRGHLAGDGHYSKLSSAWLEKNLSTGKALLTPSCTAALEMTSILANISPGDEVIMPSYTFVSTANAFVLRGAVPVFVDIRQDTLNIDETKIEEAITSRTRAIVPVHYAGVSCEMDEIMAIARKYNLLVIEDAAQAIGSSYKGKPLGTIGHLGCLSFHETKNISCGEGGALLINDDSFAERAEIVREKGTDRSRFNRGETDKYTWQDKGSSFLPSEIAAAFLFAQLENFDYIQALRLEPWLRYNEILGKSEKLQNAGIFTMPQSNSHNAHMFYLLAKDNNQRQKLREFLLESGIMSVSHYVPLHNSPAGTKYSRYLGDMSNTNIIAQRLLRLPLYSSLGEESELVASKILQFAESEKS